MFFDWGVCRVFGMVLNMLRMLGFVFDMCWFLVKVYECVKYGFELVSLRESFLDVKDDILTYT